MRLVQEDYIIALKTSERDALLEALDDASNRYEASDEHADNKYYDALCAFAALLEQDPRSELSL